MVIDEINSKGGVLGKKFEFVVYDNKFDKIEVLNVVIKLVIKENVLVMLGLVIFGVIKLVFVAVQCYKVLLIFLIVIDDFVIVDERIGKMKLYIFRICFNDLF